MTDVDRASGLSPSVPGPALRVFVGPVFSRELVTLPRRGRIYVARAAYGAALLALMSTAWQVLAGTQIVRNVGDFARFGASVFQVLAPLELAAALFFAALGAAAAVAQEKDRRTFDLLLLTNLNNCELVLGKLSASLLGVVNVVVAVVPIFALTALVGGVGPRQIVAVFVITLAGVVAAGSLGSTIALWREKSYQTLSLTALVIVAWTAAWELVARGASGASWPLMSADAWATTASSWHALFAALRPWEIEGSGGVLGAPIVAHVLFSVVVAAALNAVAVLRVRRWNPSREMTPRHESSSRADAPRHWSLSAVRAADHEQAESAGPAAIAARGLRRTRTVWDNPILWREMMTWAYGRKVLLVRAVFVAACAAPIWNVYAASYETVSTVDVQLMIVPIGVLGVLLVNMQAVTSITSERDARAMDLLLVTDLTPKEFVFGKLAGIVYNTKEMIVLPLALCALLWHRGLIGGEAAAYLAVGWSIAVLFAAVLGLHVGMNYVVSRTAVAVSLATTFFLVVGVAVSMRIMIAFSGSFQAQLQPFLAMIVGGGVGLYAALGRRNASPAIMLASFLLPLATFYAITSFLLGAALATLLAMATAYGFAATALLVPAVYEFDVATGRTTGGEERE